MKVLVTGASGFVGAAVVRAALRRGHHVVGAARKLPASRLSDVSDTCELIELDLRDKDAVSRALSASAPDGVIHCAWAGVANSARFELAQVTDNIEAVCHLVSASASAGVTKFVGMGSQAEYGPKATTIRETDTLEPTTLYGAAKVSAFYLTRQLADQYNMGYAWLRLFSTYGPGDNPNWLIPMLVREMLAGRRPKTTAGTQLWDYLYIDDVAEGLLAAATSSDAQGGFNLGSGAPVPVRHIVERIRDLAAPDLQLVFGEVPFRPDQVMHMEADISRLVAATGWRPQVDMDSGLARTVSAAKDAAGAPDSAS